MFRTDAERLIPIDAGDIRHTPAIAIWDIDAGEDTTGDGTHTTTGQHATDIDLLRAMDIGGQIATIITGELATDINVAIKPVGTIRI